MIPRLFVRVTPLLLCCLLCIGCSTTPPIDSEGNARWSELDLSLTLPPGQWKTETLEEGRYTALSNEATGSLISIFRLNLSESLPPAVAIRRLFATFEKKELVSESPAKLADGTEAWRAKYIVNNYGNESSVMAIAFRKESQMYEVAAWGIERQEFDALVSSIVVSQKMAGENSGN